MDVPHCDRLRRRVGARQHRRVTDRLRPHKHPLPGERLTGVHVGNTIDLGHTVRRMTLGAQRSATGRMQTGPQECGEEMVTGNELHRHCIERELSQTGHDASLERRAARPVRPVARCLPAWLCDDATAASRTLGRSSTGPMTKDKAMARHEYSAPLTGDARIVERPDGTRLRTFCAGTGPKTVLLAHGYGFGAWEWNLVEPQLVERGFRVITFDQRGHQGSSIGSDGINLSLIHI